MHLHLLACPGIHTCKRMLAVYGLMEYWDAESLRLGWELQWWLGAPGCLTEMNTAGYRSRRSWESGEQSCLWIFMVAESSPGLILNPVEGCNCDLALYWGFTSSRTTKELKSSLVTAFTSKTRPSFLPPSTAGSKNYFCECNYRPALVFVIHLFFLTLTRRVTDTSLSPA